MGQCSGQTPFCILETTNFETKTDGTARAGSGKDARHGLLAMVVCANTGDLLFETCMSTIGAVAV